MEKTFFEKLGDTLDHMGKRALVGLVSGVIGILLMCLSNLSNLVIPIGFIGLALFLGGFWTMLSIIEFTKAYYVTGISVRTSSGECIPCTIVKQKKFACVPLVPFVCPFFYVPYKTQFYLIKNMVAPNIAQGSKIREEAISYGCLNLELITKAKYQALVATPDVFSEEIYESVCKSREMFCNDIKPYVDTEILEEIYHTDRLSICKVLDETYLLFHYARKSGYQRGITVAEENIEKIKTYDSFWLSTYVCAENVSARVVELNEKTLERLLKNSKNINSEAAQQVVAENNKNKKILTADIISSSIKGGSCTSKRVWGIIMCFFSVGGFELLIAGIALKVIPAAILGLALGGVLLYFGVRNIKTSKQNTTNLLAGNYKIIKTLCKGYDDCSDDETVSFVTKFENGAQVTMNHPLGVNGDIFYLVYLPDAKAPNAFFNGTEYLPDDNLRIEEYVTKNF